MSTYTHISDETLAIAIHLARGDYQRNLLYGIEAWSGATIRGKAKLYSIQYKLSRSNLVNSLLQNGYSVTTITGLHNRSERVITSRMTNR